MGYPHANYRIVGPDFSSEGLFPPARLWVIR
jgi:hypothetical protein